MAVIRKVKPLGEILVEKRVLTPGQLDEALVVGKRTNTRVGNVIVKLGYATEKDIAAALADQYRLPFVMLSTITVPTKTVKLIPESVARRYMVIPVSVEADILNVAMLDPLNVFAIDELRRITGLQIKPLVSTEAEIGRAINIYYAMEVSLEDMIKRVQASGLELLKGEEDLPEKLEKIAAEASVIQLVDLLIARAVMENASDIHIEPDEDTLRVRLRVDGLLHESINLPLKLHPAIISRIKILGDVNIAEKRVPQDGRFLSKIGGRDIDIRLSTLPTIFGEKAVLRLLDKSAMILDLNHLTPFPETLDVLSRVMKRPFGLMLLTGPTGSGKTTTAYTLMNILNTMDKNLVTVEDPVEYHLKRINQVQVNPKAGVTFAGALRHILRQDPDIVMIGEIRDKETAEIAIHAALTGHLVISTIHTNDAVGTVTRLLDMGIEPYLISSAITCIVGQRLVRRICDSCKQVYDADPVMLKELDPQAQAGNVKFYKGIGCAACKGSGLKGRLGIFEVLMPDDVLRSSIVARKDSSTLVSVASNRGFRTLRQEGIRAVEAGYTTIEEIIQATQSVAD
ncbi:MAG: Flp pilus assembly complex ATPase component TadA [Deltaproteobacteria bacterium]|nr:Flp pilus assembly complex ATPase component TadA [Deltaproteobacteria bacterium]